MRKQKENKRRLIKIASFLLLIIGISFIALEFLSKNKIKNEETKAIEEFYHQEKIIKENKPKTEVKDKSINISSKQTQRLKKKSSIYIGMLKIPKINLERGLVDPKSKYNDVKYNIEIIKGSQMPSEEKGNLILAGHAGTARISYFRNLNKLVKDDDIYIYYNSKRYDYKVVKTYEVDKTGSIKILKDNNNPTLTLVSCIHKEDKQIVVIAERK